MWEEPGFLLSIAQALVDDGIEVLQMADSVGTVSCLVSREDGPRAVRALHRRFELGQ
jgi:aspartate kinase